MVRVGEVLLIAELNEALPRELCPLNYQDPQAPQCSIVPLAIAWRRIFFPPLPPQLLLHPSWLVFSLLPSSFQILPPPLASGVKATLRFHHPLLHVETASNWEQTPAGYYSQEQILS